MSEGMKSMVIIIPVIAAVLGSGITAFIMMSTFKKERKQFKNCLLYTSRCV